jgi:uncharacterized protein involved in outer membrane biogenesis
MRTTVRICAIAFGTILVVLIAAALYVRQIDAEEYAANISVLVQKATGRELVIEGPVRLQKFPTPRIVAKQLRFGNAPWGSAPAMVTAEHLELELSPLPLLIGRYEVKRLVLEAPEILLESNTEGRVNWDFDGISGAAEDGTEEPPVEPIPITLSRVAIRNAKVVLRDGPSQKTIAVPIEELSLREAVASDRLRIELQASYEDRPIRVAGKIGRWLTIRHNEPFDIALRVEAFGALVNLTGAIDKPLDATGAHFDVSLEAKSTQEIDEVLGLDLPPAGPLTGSGRLTEAGGVVRIDDLRTTTKVSGGNFRVDGTVADLLGLDGVDLDVALSADSLASIAKLGGHALPPVGPVTASGKLRRERQVVRLTELQASVGDSKLSGSMALERAGPRAAIAGELRSSHLDLTPFFADSEVPTDRLFSSKPLDFDALGHLDAKIHLVADQAVTPKFSFADLTLDLELEGGYLRARSAGTFAQGRLDANLAVDSRQTPPAVSARVTGEKMSMAEVSASLRQVQLVQGGVVALRTELSGQGASIRQIMASSSGDIQLSLVDAQIQNDILEEISRDVVTEFLQFLRPASEQGGMTELHCAVVHLPVRDGVVTVERSIAVETPDVNMSVSGVVDFRDESLDLGVLLMRPKTIDLAKGSLADLARVQGTLLQPQVETDVQRAAVALITGGVALFAKSVMDELSKDAAPCLTALEYQPAAPSEETAEQVTSSAPVETVKPKPRE